MPLLKGQNVGGYVQVKQNVKFMQSVDFNNTWNHTWFVDYDNGADTYAGTSTSEAYKNLATAIAAADEWDVIYIRPRDPDVTGGDPAGIIPATAANWSIANAKHGLQLIGCGVGCDPRQSAYQTRLQGEATVTGTAPLTVLAPYVNIENLSVKRGGATGVPLIHLSSAAAAYAFAASVYNCRLHMGNGTTGSAGAVQIDSHWYAVIKGCYFDRCSVGIGFGSGLSNPVGCRITENIFEQIAADNYGDIVSAASAVLRCDIDHNNFNHAIPSNAGGKGDYIWFQGSSTGAVTANYFATATLVTATIMTLSGLLDGGGNWTNRGWLTS